MTPARFFGIGKDGNVQSPILLVDSGDNLHAFWGAKLTQDDPVILYYSYWGGASWSVPVDVLLSPDGNSVWPTYLQLDHADVFHAFWSTVEGAIWHSTVHVSQAGNARNWATPQLIVTEDNVFTSLGLARDAKDNWYLVYTNRALDTLRIMRSTDNAATWLAETQIYVEPYLDTWIGRPDIIIAPDGALWVWWHELEAGSGRNKGVLYVRSTDRGQTWSAPERVIGGYYSGRFDVIGNVMVRLIAGGVGTGGRHIALSYDNGSTWTEPWNIMAGGGMQDIRLVVDSNGVWHSVVENEGTFLTSSWDEGVWSPPEFIVPREEMRACCTTPGRTTENAVAAITEGNRMHVIFEEDNRVLWYTSWLLDAPYVAPRPVPTPAMTQDVPTDTPSEIIPMPPTPPTLTASGNGQASDAESFPLWVVTVVGVTPALLLVVATVVIRVIRTGGQ